MSRWAWLRREAWAVAQPLAFYQLHLLVALVTFTLAIFFQVTEPNAEIFIVFAAIWAGALAGAFFGQLISLTRLRSSLFHIGMFIWYFVGTYLAVSLGPYIAAVLGPEISGVLVLIIFLGSILATGGFWSIRVNRGLLANWAPMVFVTGSIIAISEYNGSSAAWHMGNKYGIWGFTTLAILFTSLTLQIAFLAARERHRLHRWRTDPEATELVQERADPRRPIRGCMTLFAFLFLIGFVGIGAALISPYLWRTGPRDPGERPVPGEMQEDYEPPDRKDPAFDKEMMEKIQQAVKQGVQAGCALLTLLVLGIIGLFVFGPPIRRQLLLTHLRNPMWPVPPTREAHLAWRLTEIALADAGIHRQPGETALDVSRRGHAALPNLNLEALTTAAKIADRVAYGYTLEPGDPETLRRAAEMTYQAVWETLTELERMKANYRPL